MPSLTSIFLLIGAALLLDIVPGPDMLYVIARSTGQGRAAGVLSSVGIALGGLIQTSALALGLSSLFLAVPIVYDIIKYIGVVYLIYLGIRTIANRSSMIADPVQEKTKLRQVFLQGTLTTLLNPKVAFFYIAFIPQFTDPSKGAVSFQLLVLGALFNIVGLLVDSSIALLASFLGAWLKRSVRAASVVRWLTGSVFIGLGIRLAFEQRK